MKSKGTSARKYGSKTSKKVERAIHEMKHGELRSGGSGKKVTSRKQAVAIGLSEARREGGKVPPAPRGAAQRERKKVTKRTRAASSARAAPVARKTTGAPRAPSRSASAHG